MEQLSKKIILLVLVIAMGVGIYLVFGNSDIEIRVPEANLQSKLAEKLPLSKTYLFIFDVTLDEPRLDLDEQSDRILAGLNVDLVIRLGGRELPLKGTIDASGSVNYQAETGEFFLLEPVIENLEIDGLEAVYEERVQKALSKAITEFYSTRPIYALEGRTTKEAAAKLLLKDVDVDGEELVVTLGL
jgi:hypothetical protein